MSSAYDCSVEPKRKNPFCPEDTNLFNRIIHAAFVRKGVIITTLTELLAAELVGDAFIARNISGLSDGGAPQTGKGYGTQTESNQGSIVTHTLSEIAAAYNYAFWNAIEASPQGWQYQFFTKGYRTVVQEDITLEFKDPITDAVTTKQEFQGIVKYSVNAGKKPAPSPFDTDGLAIPQELFDVDTIDFVAGVSPNVATVSAETISIVPSGVMSVSLTALTDVETVTVIGTQPPWVTLTRLVQGARLTGTAPALASTSSFVLEFSNKYGISAKKTVNIVVS